MTVLVIILFNTHFTLCTILSHIFENLYKPTFCVETEKKCVSVYNSSSFIDVIHY